MIISCSEMEKGLGSFNKKINLYYPSDICVKAKRDGGKTFFCILLLRKKSPKKVLAKDMYTTIF
jgi:hypothetical protein